MKPSNQIKIIEYLVKNHADLNARDKYGFTALHYAALTNNLEATKLLLEQDNINVNSRCMKKKISSFGHKWFKKCFCNK